MATRQKQHFDIEATKGRHIKLFKNERNTRAYNPKSLKLGEFDLFELLQRLLFGEALLLQTADLLPQKLKSGNKQTS